MEDLTPEELDGIEEMYDDDSAEERELARECGYDQFYGEDVD